MEADDRVQAAQQAAAADAGLRYVARQPILDLRGRVYGYELLFRNGPGTIFSGDGDLATRTILDNTLIFGWEKLASGAMVFVNCTREALTEALVNVLPPTRTVLEVLESLEPTPELIEACRKLKSNGFLIALDDFTWRPELEPLVELADLIKVDFTLSDAEERRWMIRRLHNRNIAWLAEKVETQQEYEQAVKEGFTLFQGYYFCRPVLLKNRKVPANRLSQIEILQMLRGDLVNLRELSKLVERDASLTYRLLRLVNSPVCAMRQEVRSVETALLAVGEDAFRRIATLAITREMNVGQPAELLRMAFVRGRFCELMTTETGLDPTEQYLLGMLSLLPAMLRIPMKELAPALPLRNEIQQALQGADVPEGKVLNWLEQHEQGNWNACDRIVSYAGLSKERLARSYAQALVWAEAAMDVA
jgi:EAL and modified HD-GYP domain-containing signal transduction protein